MTVWVTGKFSIWSVPCELSCCMTKVLLPSIATWCQNIAKKIYLVARYCLAEWPLRRILPSTVQLPECQEIAEKIYLEQDIAK